MIKFPKSGIFSTNNYWVGEWGNQFSSFLGRCRNIFRAKMAQSTYRKMGPYAIRYAIKRLMHIGVVIFSYIL